MAHSSTCRGSRARVGGKRAPHAFAHRTRTHTHRQTLEWARTIGRRACSPNDDRLEVVVVASGGVWCGGTAELPAFGLSQHTWRGPTSRCGCVRDRNDNRSFTLASSRYARLTTKRTHAHIHRAMIEFRISQMSANSK